MSGYSDILFLVGAMIMLSMLTLNTSRSYLATTDSVVRSEIELRALARIQDIIDEYRWEQNETTFYNYFNNLENNPQNVTVNYGSYDSDNTTREDIFTISAEISDLDPSDNNPRLHIYFVELTIKNDYLTPPIEEKVHFIKSYPQI